VQQRLAGELARIDDDAPLLRDLEVATVTTATPHEAHTLYVLPTVPGIGKILSRGLVYAMHDLTRCPRGQAFGA
jgi:hypothetical protein